ncbi:MAG: M16 family metallopeptidase [Bdellovibrionales bacterium]
MKSIFSISLGVSLAIIFLQSGCASHRKSKPQENVPAANPTTFKNERIETLPNGIKVYFVPDDSLPRLSLQVLFPVGTVSEKPEQSGLNALTSRLLDQGTKSKSALEVADLLADYGADFSSQAGADFTVMASSSLSTQFPKLLDLFFEIVTSPSFSQEDFERIRQQMLVQIKGRRDRSGPWSDFLMMQKFYEGTAYGRDVLGTEETLKRLTRQDVVQFYRTHYSSNGALVAVAGRLTPEIEKAVKARLSSWGGNGTTPTVKTLAGVVAPQGQSKIETPHKAQTEIRIIQPGIPRAHPDYLKLRLANEILGGSFASRLNQKVRDDLGLTYSIYSYLDTRALSGAWVVSTFSKNETAVQTIEETRKVLQTYYQEGPSQKELDAAKNLVKAQFPRALETADKLAFNFLVLDFYGIGPSYLINFEKTIDSYSLRDIHQAVRNYLKPDQLLIMSFQ